MKILAVGDSFTYGEELENKNLAWPQLLADRLGYELTNYARPASGNTRIVRNVTMNASYFDLIIIAWSHFARIEFADEIGSYDLWPGCHSSQHDQSAPWRVEAIDYITKHHSDNYLYRKYLINIVLLQTFLKANNKNYIMLDAFGNNKVRNRFTEKNQDLLNQIDTTKYLGWPNESMMEWTYSTPQGPRGHFLEQGHEIVADKIYEHIRNLSWVS
jgi:hypothetical protein